MTPVSTTEDHKEREVYELGYLVLPSIAEENVSDVVNAIKGIINKVGGTEVASEDPLKFDLAYTMSKTIGARKYIVDEAYIGWVKFECEPNCAPEVSDAVKKLDEILRHLLVKAPRETTFTFAGALKAKEDKEKERQEAQAEGLPAQSGDKPKEAPPEPVVE